MMHVHVFLIKKIDKVLFLIYYLLNTCVLVHKVRIKFNIFVNTLYIKTDVCVEINAFDIFELPIKVFSVGKQMFFCVRRSRK